VATVQLNCRVEALLAKRLREAATARHTTTGALVAQAIEALLAGDSASPAPPPSALAALEARVALLEQGASPKRVIQPSPKRVSPAPHLGDLPAGGIETAALADLLGIKRGTLNARIGRAGGAREGLELEGWRCVGLQVPDRGGPARARWEPAG